MFKFRINRVSLTHPLDLGKLKEFGESWGRGRRMASERLALVVDSRIGELEE